MKEKGKNIILVLCLLTSFSAFSQKLPKIVPNKPTAKVNIVSPMTIFLSKNINDKGQRHLQQLFQYEKDRQEYLLREKARKEAQRDFALKNVLYELPSYKNHPRSSHYAQAFEQLLKMNVDSFSTKKATFLIENAFYDGMKNYSYFEKVISNTTQFIGEIMKDQNLDPNNNIDKNQVLFAFMTDTLSIGERTHYPYNYDFNDYMGQKNWDNMFVHKLITTNSGQCNSLPRYYLILAEELETESYLALAPKHSFIRFKNQEGEWYNAELTSKAIMSDQFMVESGYIKSEAILSENYLTAQTKKQLMSQLLNDLASGYISKFGYDGFIKEIIDKSLELNPDGINANIHKFRYQLAEMNFVARQLGVKSEQDLMRYPKLTVKYEALKQQGRKLKNLGFESMPQEHYEAWLKGLEKEKRRQKQEDLKKAFPKRLKKLKKLMKKILITAFLLISSMSFAQNYLYEQTYQTLVEMLEDSTKYSFKKAVFSVENAYYDGELDTLFIGLELSFLKQLTTNIIKSRNLKYNGRDKSMVAKYAALYSVMTDSLKVIRDNENYLYVPYVYDFDDIWGERDWSKMFVSKLLTTNSGNCHSLPYLYKILAEEIGADTHLALAPNHVYIKHQNLKNGWYNTELTSGYFPKDGWIMASGYVHLDGVRNGMYMKALNDQESIALVLVDLAQGYQRKFPYNDDSFVFKCLETALRYYPNLASALLLKLETTKKRLERLAEKQNKKLNEVMDNPKAQIIWKDLNNQVRYIHELGYRQMPKEMYLDWLISLKEEQDKYVNKKINTFKTQN